MNGFQRRSTRRLQRLGFTTIVHASGYEAERGPRLSNRLFYRLSMRLSV